MNKIIFGVFAILTSLAGFAQDFNFDNKYYHTIPWNEFFRRLDKNPGLVFFDIRRPGERGDSSENPSMNQGKIKGAIETDFYDFEKYYPEFVKHKNDSIYLYCSHSRRSRMLAKRLADSSFKNVFSINGGLSHLNSYEKLKIPGISKYISTQLRYQQLSPIEFVKLANNKHVQLVDVRPDSIYEGRSATEWENALGHIKGACHIPVELLNSELKKLDKSRPVLLFDNDGELSPQVANVLTGKGYQVSVLFFGLDNLISYVPARERLFSISKYNMLLPSELAAIAGDKNTVIVDVRTVDEFNSADTTEWKNVGRLKYALNIPLSDATNAVLSKYRGRNIILYDLMMHNELFEFAKRLNENGIKNYSLLYGGILQFKWEAHNTEKTNLREMLYKE